MLLNIAYLVCTFAVLPPHSNISIRPQGFYFHFVHSTVAFRASRLSRHIHFSYKKAECVETGGNILKFPYFYLCALHSHLLFYFCPFYWFLQRFNSMSSWYTTLRAPCYNDSSPLMSLILFFSLFYNRFYFLRMFEGGNDHYAFVEFADHVGASASLSALNQRLFLGKVSEAFITHKFI